MNINIFKLTAEHSAALSQMLTSERSEYSQYFTPFSYEAADLTARLQSAQRDQYWGVQAGEVLAGFFHVAGI